MPLPACLQRPATRALLLVALSFAGWGGWALSLRFLPLFGGVSGRFSDAMSHMNAARLFTQCGTCLWRQPVEQFMRRYNLEEQRQLPEEIRALANPRFDVFVRPGWPLDKPLLLNWPFLPRPYPPGALVLAAPTALVYHFTSLSYAGATRLLNLSYLAYVHLGLFFLLRGWFSGTGRDTTFGLLGALLLYNESVHWALEGFYDGAVLAPLVLCGHYLQQRRGLAALVCYCAAAFLHYRAYLFAPLALYALWLVLKEERPRWPWGARQWSALAAIVVLGGASLYTFWLLSPWLARFPATNPLRDPNNPALARLLFTSALAAVPLLLARAWVDLALVGWITWMNSRIYQTMPWHVICLLMWLALPVWGTRAERFPLVRDVRLAFVVLLSVLVYNPGLLLVWWA